MGSAKTSEVLAELPAPQIRIGKGLPVPGQYSYNSRVRCCELALKLYYNVDMPMITLPSSLPASTTFSRPSAAVLICAAAETTAWRKLTAPACCCSRGAVHLHPGIVRIDRRATGAGTYRESMDPFRGSPGSGSGRGRVVAGAAEYL